METSSKRERALRWVQGYAVAGATLTPVTVAPGATTAALFTIETSMVLHIGRIYRGEGFTPADAVRVSSQAGFSASVGLGSKAAMEGLNFIPVVGWAAKGFLAATVIRALGDAIIGHFQGLEPLAEVKVEQPAGSAP